MLRRALATAVLPSGMAVSCRRLTSANRAASATCACDISLADDVGCLFSVTIFAPWACCSRSCLTNLFACAPDYSLADVIACSHAKLLFTTQTRKLIMRRLALLSEPGSVPCLLMQSSRDGRKHATCSNL